MEEKHTAVISCQLCNILYNEDLLGVGGGSELKTFSTDFWLTKTVTQFFTHEFKATDCIPSCPFIEVRRRKSPPPILSDGELKAWLIPTRSSSW